MQNTKSLYHIKDEPDDKPKGPYTLGQLKTQWAAGVLHAKYQYSVDSCTTWHPILDLQDSLESTVQVPPPKDGVREAAIETEKVKAQLKSIPAAVLLALFLPVIGAAYVSIGITISCAVVGLLVGVLITVLGGEDSGSSGLWIGFGLAYIASIFWALLSAQDINDKILNKKTE
jgi:hypothetical protein